MIHATCNGLVTGLGDCDEGSVKGLQAPRGVACTELPENAKGKLKPDISLTQHNHPPQQAVLLKPQHRLQGI